MSFSASMSSACGTSSASRSFSTGAMLSRLIATSAPRLLAGNMGSQQMDSSQLSTASGVNGASSPSWKFTHSSSSNSFLAICCERGACSGPDVPASPSRRELGQQPQRPWHIFHLPMSPVFGRFALALLDPGSLLPGLLQHRPGMQQNAGSCCNSSSRRAVHWCTSHNARSNRGLPFKCRSLSASVPIASVLCSRRRTHGLHLMARMGWPDRLADGVDLCE